MFQLFRWETRPCSGRITPKLPSNLSPQGPTTPNVGRLGSHFQQAWFCPTRWETCTNRGCGWILRNTTLILRLGENYLQMPLVTHACQFVSFSPSSSSSNWHCYTDLPSAEGRSGGRDSHIGNQMPCFSWTPIFLIATSPGNGLWKKASPPSAGANRATMYGPWAIDVRLGSRDASYPFQRIANARRTLVVNSWILVQSIKNVWTIIFFHYPKKKKRENSLCATESLPCSLCHIENVTGPCLPSAKIWMPYMPLPFRFLM